MAYSPEGIKFTVRDSVSPKVSGQLSLSIQHHRDTTARQLYFFKPLLSDINRKKFFVAVLRSFAMNYDPIEVNFKLFITLVAPKPPYAMHNTVYGHYRPIDLFLHDFIQCGNQVPVSKTIELSNSIRILLANTATHLRQYRVNQAYKDTGFETETPQIYPKTKISLVDTSQIFEARPANVLFYKELLEALTAVSVYFFKPLLSDINRKKFFVAVLRSFAMNYDPIEVNFKLFITLVAPKPPYAMHNTVYGHYRPIDLFLHDFIQCGNQVPVSKTIELSNSIRILLANTATHLRQYRVNQAYKDTGFETETPQIYPKTKISLVDTSQIFEARVSQQASQMAFKSYQPRSGEHCPYLWVTHDKEVFGAQERYPVDYAGLENGNNFETASSRQPDLVERSSQDKGWSELPSGGPGSGILPRCERLPLGDIHWPESVLRNMDQSTLQPSKNSKELLTIYKAINKSKIKGNSEVVYCNDYTSVSYVKKQG
ncbi:hypothetical protein AYI69_g3053 [Smittium culicis]|uniref:Uncharacterized protein n=1 Tax=Smittium culicis TaxID=133412 RepID=A0A1R1YKT3_9FUNG|nr:hypothetical protein AYI69_g3053 [Smittium culicis]